MPRMVCTPCQQTYRADNNSIVVVTYAQETPYQLWFADEWKCPTCDHRVVSGFGDGPIWRRQDGNFDETLRQYERSWVIRHERELVQEAEDTSSDLRLYQQDNARAEKQRNHPSARTESA